MRSASHFQPVNGGQSSPVTDFSPARLTGEFGLWGAIHCALNGAPLGALCWALTVSRLAEGMAYYSCSLPWYFVLQIEFYSRSARCQDKGRDKPCPCGAVVMVATVFGRIGTGYDAISSSPTGGMGRVTVKVAPFPTVLVTSIFPPSFSTMPWVMDSPSPVP